MGSSKPGFEFEKMAFERKRFCFNLDCKITEEEYKDESNFEKGTYEWYLSNGGKTKFKICTNCVIADFCGKTCQEQAWKDGHKNWCFTVNVPKKNRAMERQCGDPRQRFINFDLRNAYLMSAHFKSYRGVKVVLKFFLDQILINQPNNLPRRYGVPMMYLNLGQDDDAYNFIKFWLLETKKTCDMNMKCTGQWKTRDTHMKCTGQWNPFIEFEDQKPFDKMSLKGQDKEENLIKELNIDVSQPPCYLDSLFFIHLSIIKCNTMNGMPKDQRKEQESHLEAYLKYIDDHYPGLPRNLISTLNTSEDEAIKLRGPHVCSGEELTENYSKTKDLLMPESFGFKLDEDEVEFIGRLLSFDKFKLQVYLSRARRVQDKIYQVLRKYEKRVHYGKT